MGLSFLNKIKDKASKAGQAVSEATESVRNKAAKVDKTINNSKLITSTLKEFGTVEKAIIGFSNGSTTDIMKVQINPYDIHLDLETMVRADAPTTAHISGDPRPVESEKNPVPKGRIEFMLNYDFYDEYYARSANGSGLSLNSLSSGNGFHLLNETYSSLARIMKYSRTTGYYVYFKWGPFSYFGTMERVQPRYTAFSPWGEPLKANINVTINIMDHEHLNDPESKNTAAQKAWVKLDKKLGPGSSAFDSVEGTFDSVFNKAGSTIKALR